MTLVTLSSAMNGYQKTDGLVNFIKTSMSLHSKRVVGLTPIKIILCVGSNK